MNQLKKYIQQYAKKAYTVATGNSTSRTSQRGEGEAKKKLSENAIDMCVVVCFFFLLLFTASTSLQWVYNIM